MRADTVGDGGAGDTAADGVSAAFRPTIRLLSGKVTTLPSSPPVALPARTIRTLDLFSGVGGLSEGFRQASSRFTTVGAVEMEPRAAAGWSLNHGSAMFAGRIEDWLATGDVPQTDIVIGGPPCQGFSSLGKRDANDLRNQLWRQYAHAVAEATPYYFVMENVPQLLSSPQFRLLQAEIEPGGLLADYTFTSEILNAAEYGTAQTRRRAIIIGHHRDLPFPGWPDRSTPEPTDQLTVRKVIGDLVDPMEPDAWRTHMTGRDPANGYIAEELHVTRNYSDLSRKRFKEIPREGSRFDLPVNLQCAAWRKHSSGSADVMGRLYWDRPSVTLRTEFNKPEKGRYLHPEQDRAITAYEGALLQGFPPDYKFVGPMTEIVRQIGNAVPIPLGRAIAERLLSSL